MEQGIAVAVGGRAGASGDDVDGIEKYIICSGGEGERTCMQARCGWHVRVRRGEKVPNAMRSRCTHPLPCKKNTKQRNTLAAHTTSS